MPIDIDLQVNKTQCDQNRIFPENENSLPFHIFDCQQYPGKEFLEEVATEMQTHRIHEYSKSIVMSQSDTFGQAKGSIVAQVWGIKLAEFVKNMQELDAKKISGYEDLMLVNSIVCGKNFLKFDDYRKQAINKYIAILSKLRENANEIQDIQTETLKTRETKRLLFKIDNEHKELSEKIDLIIEGTTFEFARAKDNIKIYPTFVDHPNLRIIVEADYIKKILSHANVEIFNEQHELEIQAIIERERLQKEEKKSPMKKEKNIEKRVTFNDYVIAYPKLSLQSKWRFVANILYLLHIDFNFLNKRTYLMKNNEEEYMFLLKGLIDGFEKVQQIDPKDINNLHSLQKDQFMKSKATSNKIPGLIESELFLVCLEQLERQIDRLKEEIENSKELLIESEAELKRIKNLTIQAEKQEQDKQSAMLTEKENQYEKERAIGYAKIGQIKKIIKILIEKTLEIKVETTQEEFVSLKMETNLYQNKQKIPQSKQQKSFDRKDLGLIEVDEEAEKIRKIAPGLKDTRSSLMEFEPKQHLAMGVTKDQVTINREMIDKDPKIEKYQEISFLKDMKKDPLMETWFKKEPYVMQQNPKDKDSKRDFLVVEKAHWQANQLQNEAIEKEVKRFQDFMKTKT